VVDQPAFATSTSFEQEIKSGNQGQFFFVKIGHNKEQTRGPHRKLVSPSPSRLLSEDQFGLYAVTARFPHNLAGQIPWQQRQAGVYDCRWGTDTIRVVVAGELSCEAHNAPLHLFSASPHLVEFGSGAYRRRSEQTSRLLGQLFERLQGEGFAMSFTMEDFNRQYIKEHFPQVTAEEQEEVLQALPPERRLAGLSA
jgi:hypothetical protein